MGSLSVVVNAPPFDHCLGLFEAVEDLSVQALVSELAIEGLAVAIFSRRAWLDVQALRP